MRRVLLTILVFGLSVSSAFAQGDRANQRRRCRQQRRRRAGRHGVRLSKAAQAFHDDTVTGANGRYSFPSIAAHHVRNSRGARRASEPCAARTSLCRRTRTSRVNITLELGDLSETITVAGRSGHRRHLLGDHQRSRRLEAHRRVAASPAATWRGCRRSSLARSWRQVSEETGQIIPGAVRISANGAESSARTRTDWTARTIPTRTSRKTRPSRSPTRSRNSPFRRNYSAAQGASAGAVVNVVTRSGTNNFHGGAFELLARSHVQLEELLRRRAGLPEAQPVRRVCGRSDRTQQHVLLRRLAGHAHHEPRIRADQVRADGRAARGDFSNCAPRARSSITRQPGCRFPEQPDSGRSFDPAAVKVFAACRRPPSRTARSKCLAARPGLESVHRQGRPAARREQPGQRPVLSRRLQQRIAVPSREHPELYRPESRVGSTQSEHRHGVEADDDSSTLLNESASATTASNGAPAASGRPVHAGLRHPASVLPDRSVDLRDQGARILQLRRQPRSVIPTRRVPVQQQDELDQGTARDSVRRRARVPCRPEIYNDFRRAGHFISNGQSPVRPARKRRACARRFPARQAQHVRSWHGRIQELSKSLSVVFLPGRLQDQRSRHAEFWRAVRANRPLARPGRTLPGIRRGRLPAGDQVDAVPERASGTVLSRRPGCPGGRHRSQI